MPGAIGVSKVSVNSGTYHGGKVLPDGSLAPINVGYDTLRAMAGPTGVGQWDDPPLLVPFRLKVGTTELSMFTTLTTFGTPRDVTLDELCVEFFFPADDATERLLRDPGPA